LFGAANKASAGDKHAKKAMLPAAATTPDDEPAARKPLAVATHEESNALLAPPPAPVTENKPAPAKPTAKPENKPVTIAEKSSTPAPSKAKPALAQEPKPAAIPPVAKPAAIPTVAASSESKSKGRFALQLSSFQDKGEAEAFAQKFDNERPYMVVSEIEGKGTWYRVRVGDYASAKDATAAKQSFEKKHNVIAYIAQK
jgi:septal ring-binding cell division protein DamX